MMSSVLDTWETNCLITSTGFGKSNKYLLNKYHLPIYFLKNSLLIQKFDMLFSKFKQTNFVHKYTAEKIENLYLANKSLLHRIMENK